ncbi:MAG: TIR domain-containing protein [Actinobacteria bacterium]|jgi:class 3 adenylate cyclase/tetratricopeptide (TPR) repeat protein|nr:MAG: TIR domain-containing protein [Actinomycetota bacterium]
MGNIFISHVIADEPLIREIARGLEEAGYNAWFFERDVLPGTSYLIQITQAIESCDALVLLVTLAALSSDQVTKEVVGAFERRIPFVPVLVGVTPPELKESQPEWRHALGGTAMLCCEGEDLSSTVPRVIEGLRALGIEPGETPTSTTVPVASAPGHISERALSSRPSLEGERKQVTVLCASASVPTSREIDPEEAYDLIRPVVDIMAEETHRYEGAVAQFSGDGLTAIFGAPLAHEDDPQRALYAALAIRKRLAEHEKRLEKRGIELTLRIGINTGLIKVDSIGDDLSMAYTPLGDTVNLASQLSASAQPGDIRVSETTLRLAEGYFEFARAEEVEREGRKHPSWRVLGALPARGRMVASISRGLSPFVGRERELEHLARSYQKAREGSGQVVGVVGEAGMGKSRLLLEFRKSLPKGEYTYLEGGCVHYGEAMPYLPILDMLRSYFDIAEGEDEETGGRKLSEKLSVLGDGLDHILPPLRELLSLPVDDESYLSLEPAQRRERAFEAIRILLVAESRRRPLILAVEDLHWMDRTSEDFLSYFIESMPTAPILLLLLHRPDYTPAWTSRTPYSQVRVESLPERRSSELIAAILHEGEVSPDLSDFITAKAAGNPLFIEELTRSLLESGAIVKEGESYALSTEPSEVKVPATVQGIIASRLDRLPGEEKETLQVAAVIGREFSLRLLEEVTGITKPLKSSLMQLQSLELIYEKSLFPEPEFIFKHALTQEVAYESLPLKRRKELHERIGRAIEELYPERLEDLCETLAHHYSRSDNAERAIHYLRLSGDRATRDYANWEAIRLYEEAIRILDARPESEETKRTKLDIYISILDPAFLLGFPEGSIEFLEEAEKLAEELSDDASLVAVYRRFALFHTFRGDVPLGVEYSWRCFDTAEKAGDVEGMAFTAFGICSPLFFAGDVLEVAMIGRRVIEALEEKHLEEELKVGAWTVYSDQCGWCGQALGMMGEFEEAKAVLEKGLEHALEIDDVLGAGYIDNGYCNVASLEGDTDGLVHHASRAIERYEESGVNFLLGTAMLFLGLGRFFLGDYETAREGIEKGSESNREVGVPIMLPFFSWALSLVDLGSGEPGRAKAHAEEALRLAQEHGAKLFETLALMTLGRAEGEEAPSRLREASEQIRRGISMAEEMMAKPFSAMGRLFLGEVFELAGLREEALESLHEAEDMCLEMGVIPDSYWLTRTREALARLEHD